MKTVCSYCSMSFDEQESACPYCGAPNENVRLGVTRPPRTIEELKNFCFAHSMPLERMRFFIGKDYRGPRAFGIYRDRKGDFVVYKNKSDGTRAVRYKGPDEARAVNEIYQKLKEEVQLRKSGGAPVNRSAPGQPARAPSRSYSPPPSRSYSSPPNRSYSRRRRGRLGCVSIAVIIIVVMFVLGAIAAIFDDSPSQGYYHYNDNYYYYQRGSWYVFDRALSAWQHATVDDAFLEDYDDYYSSTYLHDDYAIDDFQDSIYYEPYSSSSSYDSYDSDYDSSWDDDWDSSDWDYDYDSWDSGDTDWDSDW